MLCPFCSAEYTRAMLDIYNSSYGCDTGCEYYRIEIVCGSCGKNVYIKGDFGEFENEIEKQGYLDEVKDADIIEAIKNK